MTFSSASDKNSNLISAQNVSIEDNEFSSKPLSVQDLNHQIKMLLEGQLNTVWVRGEISNFKPHTSGHYYFSLKDANAQISAVMFRGSNSRLKFRPQDGLEVLVRGKITVYEPRGNYQIICDSMEPVGAGALQKAFEQLKLKLKAEGLFESSRKKSIPQYPSRIAIVTSPTGAALQDMLNIYRRRNPLLEIILVPTLVQGEGAVEQIKAALEKCFLISDLDLIIFGRGGGSIEDLWAFNDESLARLIAKSPVPTISAVGHEIDYTIGDFVADLRAPTPSAAAELSTFDIQEVSARISSSLRQLLSLKSKVIKEKVFHLTQLQKRLIDPQRKLMDLIFRNDELMQRLQFAIQSKFNFLVLDLKASVGRLKNPSQVLDYKRQDLLAKYNRLHLSVLSNLSRSDQKLKTQMSLLNSLSPLNVLDRGYAIAKFGASVISDVKDIKLGDIVNVRLASGEFSAKVEKIRQAGDKNEV